MEHHENDKPMTFKESVSAFIAWAQIIGLILELPFRRFGTMGEKFASGRMAVSAVIMVVAIILIDGQGAPPVNPLQPPPPWWHSAGLVTGCVAVGLLVCHKLQEKKLKATGYEVHSMYSGRSILDWGGTPESEMRAKSNTEPAIAFVLGMAALVVSMGLGVWMMVAAVGMGVSVSVARAELEARRRAVRDAMLEQRHVMNGIRNEDE